MSSFPADSHAPTPPILPPKPSSQEPSRIGTPASGAAPPPPPSTLSEAGQQYRSSVIAGLDAAATAAAGGVPTPPPPPAVAARSADIPDPGDQWLPQVLQDKSIQDLADILSSPSLLNGLTNSPSSIHPSLQASHQDLLAALSSNIDLATRLSELESRLAHQRSAAQAQLLSMHALERQWRQKQSDMDLALARFSPAALYQLLNQSVQEQALVCQAMEESFLDRDGVDGGGGEATTSEREAAEWIRRYREAKVQYYLRQERKERWDEGRVGGWR
ncbi:hypothetical protein ACSS6W_003142 [Trichoderma asperelloides]|uniref:VPS37 C-terminal domain-containing protein n=1 Tax=Trichoderma asperellum TaxID=101201 RepID=A0A6V8QJV5_TRIAP|nr:hypothetical protein LI328DRAFT_84403 [Trichoderma asperelloides]GFP52760.1 hypothetical protein TASIC1_0001091200 [Trichoderma asperellum]